MLQANSIRFSIDVLKATMELYIKEYIVKWILLMALLSGQVYANLHKAPHNFTTNNKLAVFSDITKIETVLHYDLDQRKAMATSRIEFTTQADGYPLFDLRPNILESTINGKAVSILLIDSPNRETKYRMIDQELAAGTHILTLKNEVKENIEYKGNYLSAAFWMSDLTDRNYIEQYLPSNVEYDQYHQILKIKITGAKATEHIVYTNAALTIDAMNEFTLDFPDYFTASSFFMHITKKGRLPSESLTYTTGTGKVIPVTVYAKSRWSLSGVPQKIPKILKELEKKFGEWAHPSLVVYIAGMGGMEHSGATITSESALGHELTHSYFARGVMPVDGNSGWMDEAIASWRDDGYKARSRPNFSSTSMSAHSTYRRYTDRKAYNQGARFMEYLNHKLSGLGGLELFLKGIHTKYIHKNISTLDFQKELEGFSGMDFSADFKQYIYGNKTEEKSSLQENPFHPKLTKQQLRSLL